ncbi:MAG: hypothetical protein CTY12_03435 [Methylotenera sp.]|nr:MAG: hypothetical protein CTY12_03435 [Methylotenera sp.]
MMNLRIPFKDLIQIFGIILSSIIIYEILDMIISDDYSTIRIFVASGLALGVSLFAYPTVLKTHIVRQQYDINLRMYEAVLRANQAINECITEEQLFEKIVDLVTRQSGLDCAWIGKFDPDTNDLRPITSAGITLEELNGMLLPELCDVTMGVGLGARSFRSGESVIETNLEHPLFDKIVRDHHWKSGAAFPILCFQRPCIIMTVYSSDTNTFDTKNVQLLEELSTHIGFAIDAYATQQRQRYDADQYKSILQTTGDGFWVVDQAGQIIDVNDRYCNMVGYTRDEVINKHVWDFSLSEKSDVLKSLHDRQINPSGLFETNHRTKNNEVLSIEISYTYQPTANVFISFLRDITDRKRTEDELNSYINRVQYLAFHDSLTGLPNRAVFLDRAQQSVFTSKRLDTAMAVMIIDFDNFKHVNDSLGHAGGDFLLQSMATRMQANVRDCDTLARLGGDEFGLIIDNLPMQDAVNISETIARKLINCMQQPLLFEDHPMYMSISIGVAIHPTHSDMLDALLKRADLAMYQAKDAGRNNFKIYTESQYPVKYDQLDIQNGLHRALYENNIVAYYQPKLDIRLNRVCGAEALVRWNDGNTLVPPSVFIPISEESNLISLICERVMELACEECSKWHAAGSDMTVAVNLSVRQFQDDYVVDMIRRSIQQYELSPNAVEVEITESIAIHDSDAVRLILGAISEIGVSIAMDDFGTGYSSLSGLRDLPINVVKIDQSFIRQLNIDEESTFMVRAILHLAKGLKLTTVAEGVETEEQLRFLKEHGCDVAQGYLIGKPMTADEFYSTYISCN